MNIPITGSRPHQADPHSPAPSSRQDLTPDRYAARGAPGAVTLRGVVLAVPAVVPVALVIGVSVVGALAQSLGLMPFIGEPVLSTDAWAGSAGDLGRSVLVSAYIAVASTVASVIVGFVIALYVLATPRMGRIIAGLSAATIPIPHLIGAGAIGLLLSDSGFLDRTLGLPPAFPTLVGGSWFGAVIFEYAWKESAFVALVLIGSMSRSVSGMCDAAATLGATAWQRIIHVVLPLSRPALAVSALIVFVYTFGSYEAAWLLGPTSPEPVSVRAVRLFGSVDLAARPEAMATALVSLGAGIVAILAGLAMMRRSRGLR